MPSAPGQSRPSSTELKLVQTAEIDAFKEWQAAHKQLFDISLPDSGAHANFHAHLLGKHLGNSIVFQERSVAQLVRRDRARIRQSTIEHIEVQVLHAGHLTGEFQGRLVEVRAGDVSLVDLAREMSARSTEYSTTTLILPRSSLPKPLRGQDVHGVVLDGGKASTRLLALHLTAIAETAEAFTADEASAAVQAAFVIAQSAWTKMDEVDPALRHDVGRTMLQSVLAFIDRHLLDDDLGPEMIASSLQMSRSTLYRLFAASSGVSAYITSRRLDACYDEIANDRTGSTLIGQIAFSHGFTSEAHFSRVFRKRFGASPRDVRGSADIAPVAPPHPGAPVSSAVDTVNEWLGSLGRPIVAERTREPPPTRHGNGGGPGGG